MEDPRGARTGACDDKMPDIPQLRRLGRALPLTLTLTLAAVLLAGCMTPSPLCAAHRQRPHRLYRPALASNRYRVTFTGNSVTPRDTVESYLLLRAAEVTRAGGLQPLPVRYPQHQGQSFLPDNSRSRPRTLLWQRLWWWLGPPRRLRLLGRVWPAGAVTTTSFDPAVPMSWCAPITRPMPHDRAADAGARRPRIRAASTPPMSSPISGRRLAPPKPNQT